MPGEQVIAFVAFATKYSSFTFVPYTRQLV